MNLSIVQKVGIGNLGQIIGIIVLFFAFWTTNNSFHEIQQQVHSASERTVKHIDEMSVEFRKGFDAVAAAARSNRRRLEFHTSMRRLGKIKKPSPP